MTVGGRGGSCCGCACICGCSIEAGGMPHWPCAPPGAPAPMKDWPGGGMPDPNGCACCPLLSPNRPPAGMAPADAPLPKSPPACGCAPPNSPASPDCPGDATPAPGTGGPPTAGAPSPPPCCIGAPNSPTPCGGCPYGDGCCPVEGPPKNPPPPPCCCCCGAPYALCPGGFWGGFWPGYPPPGGGCGCQPDGSYDAPPRK
mmetsp:Transcript_8610/g.20726  ORF Transcript_8610/g.20726 Transcript_8610/m.20726 type:complete len:200 (+) Transcript_8610:849-1448(+)